MTTKFLDNKLCTFKMLLSWRFPRKTAFLDHFPLCRQGPPRGGGGKKGKKGRSVILRFPCFLVSGGLKVRSCREKQHEKCHCHTPSCVPQIIVKTRI